MSNVQQRKSRRSVTRANGGKSKHDDSIMAEHEVGSGGGQFSKGCWLTSWNNWFGSSFNSSRNSTFDQDFVKSHRRIKSEPVTVGSGVDEVAEMAGTSASNGKDVGPFKLPSKDGPPRRSKRTASLIANLPSSILPKKSAPDATMKKDNLVQVQNEQQEKLREVREVNLGTPLIMTMTAGFGHQNRTESFNKQIPTNVSWGCGLLLRLYMKCGADFGDTED